MRDELEEAHAPISIHALREEGDFKSMQINAGLVLFQSTPSARRATYSNMELDMGRLISIHALREEGDASFGSKIMGVLDFNPRPPRGGRPPTAC